MATMEAKQRAALLWGAAGIPLLFGALQSIGAITGVLLHDWPIISQIGTFLSQFTDQPEIIRQAGFEFIEAEALVFLLIFLITTAWVAFGVSLSQRSSLSTQQRERVQVGSIGLSGILYAVLFYYVFIDIFSLDFSIFSRVVFGLIPIFPIGTLIGSWWLDPSVSGEWGTDLIDDVADKRRVFETGYNDRIRPALETLDTMPVDNSSKFEVKQQKDDYLDKIETLERELQETQDQVSSGDATAPQIEQVEERAQRLNPEQELDKMESNLRDHLRDIYTDRYDQFWRTIDSDYGQSYGDSIVNIERYNSIVLPISATDYTDKKIHIKSIDAVYDDLLHNSVPIEVAVDGLNKVEQHIYGADGLLSYIDGREGDFTELDEKLKSKLDKIEDDIDAVDGEFREYVENLFDSDTKGSPRDTIKNYRSEGLDLLHECLFDEAEEEIKSAHNTVDKWIEIVDFLSLAQAVAADQRPYIEIPNFDDESELVTSELDSGELSSAFDTYVGCSVSVDTVEERLEFEYSDQQTTTHSDKIGTNENESVGTASTTSDTDQMDSSVSISDDVDDQTEDIDAVEIEENIEFHLERLRDGVKRGSEHVDVSDDKITLQIKPISDMYKHKEVYEEMDDLFNNKPFIDQYQIDVNGTAGHIEIKPNKDTTPRDCTEKLIEQYRK